MTFAPPIRLGLEEWGRDERSFDGASYLYVHEDVREEIGFDVEGAWRHWTSVGHAQGRYPPGLGRAAPRHVDVAARAARPFGLNVFGPFEAVSGLGSAARNLLEAVGASGLPFEVRPHDVSTGQVEITAEEQARAVTYRLNLVLANADQIRRLTGLYPDGTFDDSYTVAVWAWELAAFRADWHASFALIDEVWTNSRFEHAAISAVSPVPVQLVPLPVRAAEPVDRLLARARFGLPADAFVVLCAFDAGSTEQRKDPFAAIAAFRAAFGADPRRVLVVKQHGSAAPLMGRLRAARRGAGNIRLIGARLDDEDYRALQGACDALLSTHRSEGFGLNLAEFLAAGRIVIGTDYSGSRDFLDETVGFPVRARLVPVARRAGPYAPNLVWAQADPASCVAALREAAAGGEVVERRRAAARARMTERFSPEAIGSLIRGRVEAIDWTAATPDGMSATALNSLALHVTPDPARAGVAWPARLPTLTVVFGDAGGSSEALRAQIYPFWELCVVSPEPVAGGELRVRRLDPAHVAVPAIAAAEAGSGSWLVMLPPGEAAMAADGLLRIAWAIDSDEPPEMVSFGAVPFAADGRLAVRKAALLSAWAATGVLEAALARVVAGGRAVHLAGVDGDGEAAGPAARLPPDGRISVVTGRRLSSGEGAREQARALARADLAEHLVLVDEASQAPSGAETEAAAGWLAASRARFVRRGDGWLLTSATLLGQVAVEARQGEGLAAAVARLGAVGVALPLAPGRTAPGDEPGDEPGGERPAGAWTLAAHAARVRGLGLFDADHYLVSAPDVAASGVDPLAHYVEYGWRELRAPNFYFDPVWYRARYMADDPDEALDPLLHYERYRDSGVRPARHFDPAWVRRSCGLARGVDPLRFFLDRRLVEDVSPLPEFDPAYYRARRRDIAYRHVDPFEHYMRFGATEGVNPSRDFDTAFYAARHMRDVKRRDPVAGNPLLHYLENRDRQPAVTSLKAALRQETARLQLLGRAFMELSFCWYDGLPQRVDALRTYLAEPSLPMDFVPVFANELLAAAAERAGDRRLLDALRVPLADDYDDPDICARLAECFADPRCLRRDGSPVLAVVRGDARLPAFARRIARRLRQEHGVAVRLELLD